MKTYTYFAFGLRICTDFELFSIPSYQLKEGCELKISKVNLNLSSLIDTKAHFVSKQISEGFIYHVNHIATFLIKGDKSIFIQQHSNDNGLVESILMNGVIATYSSLRGLFVFSGASVAIDDKAHLIMGIPGVGISSIAAKLNQLGYKILSDQQIIVKKEKNELVIIPSLTYSKLWSATIEKLQIQSVTKSKVRECILKYYVDLDTINKKKEYQISKINVIEIDARGEYKLDSLLLDELAAIKELHKYLLTKDWKESANSKKNRFELITKLASETKLVKIKRPTAIYDVHKLVEFLLTETYG